MIERREISNTIQIGLLDLKSFATENGLSNKREIEKAGTKRLLKHLLNSDNFELDYTEEKKPFLKNSDKHISISHSHDKLAIIINKNENTGIDIELIRDKVLTIRHKFLSEQELLYADENLEKLISLWAAKETLYKIYGLKEVEFIKHLSVDDFKGNEMIGHIRLGTLNKSYLLRQETIGDYKLVYALHEL